MVLAAVGLFILVPGQAAVAFSVTKTSIDPAHSVVYGKVTYSNGSAVNGAKVQLVRHVGDSRVVLRTAYTNGSGLYRFELTSPSRYTFDLRVVKNANGSHYDGSRTSIMRTGTAFKISAKLYNQGSFLFLPVSTY
ncbi:MAG: carboxypeptidase-like regulatory domain-containing protein [Marmoricola sp.]